MSFHSERVAIPSQNRPVDRVPPAPNQQPVRVLLCEDHEVYRIGLRVLIDGEPDMVVVGEVVDLMAACSLADRLNAQVVVMRQGLVQAAPEAALRELCQQGRAVLVLAESESELDLAHALRVGVRGYLSRWLAATRLIEGVRALAKDEPALDPAFARHLVRFVTDNAAGPENVAPQSSCLAQLTERQRAVALLVAQGLTNGEIASQLYVSDATVKSHIAAVLRRLGIPSRIRLAIFINDNNVRQT